MKNEIQNSQDFLKISASVILLQRHCWQIFSAFNSENSRVQNYKIPHLDTPTFMDHEKLNEIQNSQVFQFKDSCFHYLLKQIIIAICFVLLSIPKIQRCTLYSQCHSLMLHQLDQKTSRVISNTPSSLAKYSIQAITDTYKGDNNYFLTMEFKTRIHTLENKQMSHHVTFLLASINFYFIFKKLFNNDCTIGGFRPPPPKKIV